jgi:hypothetical protein
VTVLFLELGSVLILGMSNIVIHPDREFELETNTTNRRTR